MTKDKAESREVRYHTFLNRSGVAWELLALVHSLVKCKVVSIVAGMLLQRAKTHSNLASTRVKAKKKGITKGNTRQLKEPKEPGNRETKKEVKKRSET
jgi:hypothetical protein